MKTPGTIVVLQPRGAVVEFFGGVKGFLPVDEISEAFIKDPKDHFRIGQSVAVRVISADPEKERLLVSCRTSSSSESRTEFSQLEVGSVVSGSVVEKTKTGAIIDIQPYNIRGVLVSGHLSDSEEGKAQLLKKLKVGETIESLVVLDKNFSKRFVSLSAKPSLIEDAKLGKLPINLSQIKVGDRLHGFVRGATIKGVFVGFGGNLTGLALKQDLSDEFISDPSEKYSPFQSVECYVIDVDDSQQRFQLSFKEKVAVGGKSGESDAFNPVDQTISSVDEFKPGKITKAQIVSVKETQLNVRLAENVQGRIDVSQLYDDFESIPDKKNPLKQFQRNQILDVRIIGFHDARNHRFLAISHRNSSHLVYELTARKSDLSPTADYKPLTLEDTNVGTKWLAFINNLTVDFAWVSLSPTVRGRISLIDLTHSVSELENVEKHYPIGSAVQCSVVEVGNSTNNNLKLSVRENEGTAINQFSDVKVGQYLPAFVIKVSENFALVKLGNEVVASAHITDSLDDYSNDLKMTYLPHQLVKTKVLEIDLSNKKIHVALRKSQTTDDTHSEIVDQYIQTVADVKPGAVLRAYVNNVADGGLFVSLGRKVIARVQIRNLSDSYLKDWKKYYTVGQVVRGKVLTVDSETGRVEFSLKESFVSGKKAAGTASEISELNEGDILDGAVSKVEDYGVFVRLNGTSVSGLCHRTEVADVPLQNLSKVFSEGDKVKVKILKINLEKRQVSLGLKASYFAELESDVDMDDFEVSQDDGDSYEEDEEDGVRFDNDVDDDSQSDSEDEKKSLKTSRDSKAAGVSAGLSVGFDWTASILDQIRDHGDDDEEDVDDVDAIEEEGRSRKRRKRSNIVEDKTGTLNTKLPQSVSDFERLLVGSPNSSIMWMNYMAFQLQLSEIEKAREIGQRALKTINFREEQERLNIWIALLNLENSFGTDQTVEDTFKEAVQFMDSKTIHMKLASIYGQSDGKVNKAEALYDIAMKKFGGSDISLWVTYGNFLFDHNNAAKARTLLDRAIKMLPNRNHKEIITKFAQLEYNKGEPERGRTLFEGLISSYPRRIDLWIIYLDYEIKNKDKQLVEKLFERVIGIKLSMKQAKFFFKKWLSYEDKVGDSKKVDYVKAKAAEYVSSKMESEEADEQ